MRVKGWLRKMVEAWGGEVWENVEVRRGGYTCGGCEKWNSREFGVKR